MTHQRPHLPVLLLSLVLGACQTAQNSGAVVSESVENQTNVSADTALSPNTEADTSTEPSGTNNQNNTASSIEPGNTQQDALIPSQATKTGELENPGLTEVSGLAASRRYANTLWAINDSGNSSSLFAFDTTGANLGSFTVAVFYRDWEDLASASINGESYLLIADIGDNLSVKTENTVHVMLEPLLNQAPVDELQPIHTVRFRYPDKPHNAESLAYANGYIYVLTKSALVDGDRQHSQAFRIPLDINGSSDVLVAEEIARLAIPGGTMESSIVALLAGVDFTQPTAFEIDQQNRYAYVLTYRNVYRYERAPTQSWAEALSQDRNSVHSHSLRQSEAIAIDANGVVWFTSEKRPAPLWALPPAE